VSKSAFGRQLRVAKRQILLQTALQTAFCSQGKADGGDLLLLVWSAEMRFQFKKGNYDEGFGGEQHKKKWAPPPLGGVIDRGRFWRCWRVQLVASQE
jgi:hypothetical protein